jgi:ribulose-5-phosphate 4-epimerase/fuculose-1-phosphate aldolase
MAITQLKPKSGMSEAEWRTRCDLAALYRIIARFRMTDFIYTHLSARVPGEEGTFLINQYGETFDRVRASTLVKLDYDGNVIGEGEFNQAGFTIHSAVLMARPDVNAVAHVHTRASVAVSAQKRGLRPISQQAMIVMGHLSYHDYEGVALDLDERERLGADLGDKRAMILRNHGLLTCAETIPAAWQLLYTLDSACQIQVDAMAGGAELIELPMSIADGMYARYQGETGHGEREWKAVLDILESDGADYAT